ncbi:cytochrome P450 [Stigmatella hybrida]|uniref:cytochrome P450 n=1 Tax=Stigmatella hybrida TaxID=394097 RepID=UPI001CDB453E
MPRSPWGPHRDPRWFADPDAFRPERWLGGSLEGLPKFACLPFGGEHASAWGLVGGLTGHPLEII